LGNAGSTLGQLKPIGGKIDNLSPGSLNPLKSGAKQLGPLNTLDKKSTVQKEVFT